MNDEGFSILAEDLYFLDMKDLCIAFQSLESYRSLQKDLAELASRYPGKSALELYILDEHRRKIEYNKVSVSAESLNAFSYVFGKQMVSTKNCKQILRL